MPQVIGLLLLACLFSACGSGTKGGAIFSPESSHQPRWVDSGLFRQAGFHGSSVGVESGQLDGAVLFGQRCSGCHGLDGSGKIGPNIQGQSADVIKGAAGFVIYMKWLQALTDQERQAIAGFLSQPLVLSGTPPYALVEARACGECHGRELQGGIARVTCYGCHNGPDGTEGHPASWMAAREDQVLFHGRYGRDFLSVCTTCHGPDLKGPKALNCSSCHDGRGAPLLAGTP